MTIQYLPAVNERRGRRRVVRHEWYCSVCQNIVHTEPVMALEESETQEKLRTERIRTATEGHVCNKVETA